MSAHPSDLRRAPPGDRRGKGIRLETARVTIQGTIDRANPVRPDLSLFNSVPLRFALTGVTRAQGEEIVVAFQARCPLFGTVKAATSDVQVEIDVDTDSR